jgi:DNA-directed RNA polymerase specialized sigma24 family protein
VPWAGPGCEIRGVAPRNVYAPATRRPASVARAFRSLQPAHREILTETVFRERSVNEAATTLGLPVDEVKVRVYHALRELHNALGA